MTFTISELNKSKYLPVSLMCESNSNINTRTKIDFIVNDETFICKLKTGFITLILN